MKNILLLFFMILSTKCFAVNLEYQVGNVKQTMDVEIETNGNGFSATIKGLDSKGDGFLSIRATPKGKEIGRLYNGDKITVLSAKGKWYKIKHNISGKIGWSYSKWIKISVAEEAKVKDEPQQVQEVHRPVQVETYTVEELYKMVNHQNTDLINKRIEKSLIGKTVSDVCNVMEVDENSFGSGYHVKCKVPSGHILQLLTDYAEQIEHLQRGDRTSFSGTIQSIKAENDISWAKVQSLYIKL